MPKRWLLAVSLTLISLTLTAFGAGPLRGADDTAGVDYFEKHVRPLLAEHCYGCHSQRAGKRSGGLLLDSRRGWAEGGDSGPVIVPGDAESSLLITAVRGGDDLQMPPDEPLAAELVRHLEHWVRIGAPDPRDEASPAPPALNPSDPVAGREHWAFGPLNWTRPIADPDTPAEWIRGPIDRYVAVGLREAGLSTAPPADRSTLLRRLTFQLTGLPPTPEQLAEFAADRRPDAWPRMVDRLLASPHFGERWGRHWLDLARYADSNGLDENFLFREAWRYRNWVIDSANADLPYDRFLTEQLAGDLLPYESIDQRDRQRIAAGFLVVGPKVLLGNNPENQRMEVADEQLDTIGRAVLGMTIGCARCHDHKFDPIPTADYYAMAGILTSTEVMQRRHMLGQQRVMERLVGLGEDGQSKNDEYEAYWRELPERKQRRDRAKQALELLEKQDEEALRKLATEHPDEVAAVAADAKQPHDKRLEAQRARLAECEARVSPAPPIPPRAMVPADRDSPGDERIRLAGQFDRHGDEVPRGFLRVLDEGGSTIDPAGSGRLELARWLTDAEHGAGRLAARVLANRIWQHMIGRGLVRTADNFGRTGEPPTHPELLDYLAWRLIDSRWSVKQLVREIAVSGTFARSSRPDLTAEESDPENLWLWRAHRRRLDPESMRDAMMLAAGTLDLQPRGSTVWYLGDQATAVGDNKNRRRTDFPNRSVYLPVIRNDLPELFEVFDFADPHATTGARPRTTVPTQALFLMNDPSVLEASTAIAKRLAAETDDPAEQVRRAFVGLTAEPPSPQQLAETLRFMEQARQQLASGESAEALDALTFTCHAIVASSRFQILR